MEVPSVAGNFFVEYSISVMGYIVAVGYLIQHEWM